MNFTNNDKKILDCFFTSSNEEDTVYAAKPTLPSTIIGYLIGRASRASKTFREIFLEMFEEIISENYKVINENENFKKEYIERFKKIIVDDLKTNNDIISSLEEKSINFFSKWKTHNSLRDVPHIAVFCDDLSILQTKVWEHEVVAEYQEKSTRYRPFVATNVFLPKCNQNIKNKIKRQQKKLIDVYNKIYDSTKKRDLARYLLPVGTKTAMGCMASLRSWERIVGRMLSYPTRESRKLGNNIFNHIKMLIPTFKSVLNTEDYSFLYQIESYNHLGANQKANISKMSHQNIYYIDGLIDIGAHRDLQRHRSVIQNFPDYRAIFGYDKFIKKFLNSSLYIEYEECMRIFNSLFIDCYDELKESDNIGESQYVSLLGHMTKFSYITDKNRWEYIYNLRTGSGEQHSTTPKTVHFSYSNWCKLAQRNMDNQSECNCKCKK